MAKKMKQILALVMVLILCAAQLTLPVVAAETTVTDVDNGTQTVTVVIDRDAGTKTTTTEVVTEDTETGTNTQSTTTEVVTTVPGSQTVDTNWNSTTVTNGTDKQDGPPSVQTDNNVTTTVTGSDTSTKANGHDPVTGKELISHSGSGSENTTNVDTTVTTTITTNTELSSEDTSNTDITTSSDSNPTTGTWQEGDVQQGQWTEGTLQQGELSDPTNVSSSTSAIEATNPGKAVIVMKPDGTTVSVSVDVTIDEVLSGVAIPENAQEIKDDQGNVIGYKVVTVTESSTNEVTVGKTNTSYGSTVQTPTAPEGYTEGTVTEGNVTTVTEAIKDDNGSIIGYRVTKTTVTEGSVTNTTDSQRETTTETTTAETTISLPQRPQESSTTDRAGMTTAVTVEDILENGVLVGYKTVTTYTNAEGEVMRTESNSIYGTTTSSSTTIEKDPETEVETVKTTTTNVEVNEIFTTVNTRNVTLTTQRTNNITTTVVTDEDIYQLVETEDGLYFLYKGTMQPVVALSDHGEITLEGLTPTVKPTNANDLASKTSVTNPPRITNPGDPNESQFKYVDYGLISDYRVTKNNGGNTSEVHLYKLVDSEGNAFYAYCADLDTTAYRNTLYSISNIQDESYYQNNANGDAVDHLRTIAINGYWGTSSGTGSLAAIKQLLRDNGYGSVADTITDGEAMTATQAAIWTFGNNSSSNLVKTSNPAANISDAQARKNIQTLYNLLISDALKNSTSHQETDIIDKEDITGATLELKGVSGKSSGGSKTYNADLTFTLAVDQSALTGNLKVTVQDQNGNDLCDPIQLVSEDSNFLGKMLADGSGYSYTIEDLEIAEGVKINLNLEGYQNLEKGVYLYTAASGSHTDSQTFIGIAEGKRNVNLSVELDFSVEDPQLEYIDKSQTQIRNDTRVDTREDTRTDTREDTLETRNTTNTKVTDTNTKVYGTKTETQTTEKVTKEERSWEFLYEYLLDTIDGDDGGDGEEAEETDGELEIPDEDVPLAKAPKTGDISLLWAVIGAASIGGAVALNRKQDEE